VDIASGLIHLDVSSNSQPGMGQDKGQIKLSDGSGAYIDINGGKIDISGDDVSITGSSGSSLHLKGPKISIGQAGGTVDLSGNVDASGTITANSLTDGTATLTGGALSGATTIDGNGDLTMGTITMTGFSVDANGATTTKSIDNTNGGITNAGAIAGATSVTASGAIQGGSLTDGTATLTGGALSGASTVTGSGGNITFSNAGSLEINGSSSLHLNTLFYSSSITMGQDITIVNNNTGVSKGRLILNTAGGDDVVGNASIELTAAQGSIALEGKKKIKLSETGNGAYIDISGGEIDISGDLILPGKNIIQNTTFNPNNFLNYIIVGGNIPSIYTIGMCGIIDISAGTFSQWEAKSFIMHNPNIKKILRPDTTNQVSTIVQLTLYGSADAEGPPLLSGVGRLSAFVEYSNFNFSLSDNKVIITIYNNSSTNSRDFSNPGTSGAQLLLQWALFNNPTS
jgi:hypothetical protein